MTPAGLRDSAQAVSDFMAALEKQEGFGPELAQKITVAATPVIVATMLNLSEFR